MKKCFIVQDVMISLTDNNALKMFFTLYLMAADERERSALSMRFRQDANALPEEERKALFAAMTESFKRLPAIAGNLLTKVKAIKYQSPALT